MNNFGESAAEEVQISELQQVQRTPSKSSCSPVPPSQSVPMSHSELQASETPPMPTSDNAGPLSEDEERRAYLELYKQSSGILEMHMS